MSLRVSNPPLVVLEFSEIIFNTEHISDPVVRVAWLEKRREGFGGSDAAPALNLSPYGTPVTLWLDKCEPTPDTDNEWLEAGRRMEEPIARWFEDKTGLTVTYAPFMLRSKLTPFMFADPDRYVLDPATGEWEILECKNVFITKGDDWKDGPPLHVRIQGMHYLYVTGLKRVWFAALIGGNKFVYFPVDRDDELIANMIKAEERMWTLVEMKRMPDVDGSEATREALRGRYAEPSKAEVYVDDEFTQLLADRALIKAAQKVNDAQLLEVENKMMVLMEGAEIAKVGDDVVATWKVTNRSGYTVEPTSFRQWHVPKPKEKK